MEKGPIFRWEYSRFSGLQPFYQLCLYSLGLTPSTFLKHRAK